MTLLDQHDSLCEKNQKIIISRDKGTSSKEHRADNSEHRYDVRKYQLDGIVVKNEKCCDFYYRIVCSKVNKNDLMKNAIRKFQDACGSHLAYTSVHMKEKL